MIVLIHYAEFCFSCTITVANIYHKHVLRDFDDTNVKLSAFLPQEIIGISQHYKNITLRSGITSKSQSNVF